MNERVIEGLQHCEYKVFLEGPAKALDRLLTQAGADGQTVSLEELLAPPAQLKDVDPLSLAHFHMLLGEQSRANELYEEMGLPMPEPTASGSSISPEVSADAVRVSRNVQKFGAASRRDWKREQWGVTQLPRAAYERASADALVLSWTLPQPCLPAAHRLLAAFPELTVGTLWANFAARTQGWFLRMANDPASLQSLPFASQSMGAEDVVALYLDNPPPVFHRVG